MNLFRHRCTNHSKPLLGLLTLALAVSFTGASSWGLNTLDGFGLTSSGSELELNIHGSEKTTYQTQQQQGQLHVILDNTALSPKMASRGINLTHDANNRFMAQVVPLAQNKVKVVIPSYSSESTRFKINQQLSSGRTSSYQPIMPNLPVNPQRILGSSNSVLEGLVKQLVAATQPGEFQKTTALASKPQQKVTVKRSKAPSSALAIAEPSASSGSVKNKRQTAKGKLQPQVTKPLVNKRPATQIAKRDTNQIVTLATVPTPSSSKTNPLASPAATKKQSIVKQTSPSLSSGVAPSQLAANPDFLSDLPTLEEAVGSSTASTENASSLSTSAELDTDTSAQSPSLSGFIRQWWNWLVWPIAALLLGLGLALLLTGIWFFKRFLSELRPQAQSSQVPMIKRAPASRKLNPIAAKKPLAKSQAKPTASKPPVPQSSEPPLRYAAIPIRSQEPPQQRQATDYLMPSSPNVQSAIARSMKSQLLPTPSVARAQSGNRRLQPKKVSLRPRSAS